VLVGRSKIYRSAWLRTVVLVSLLFFIFVLSSKTIQNGYRLPVLYTQYRTAIFDSYIIERDRHLKLLCRYLFKYEFRRGQSVFVWSRFGAINRYFFLCPSCMNPFENRGYLLSYLRYLK